MAAYDMAAILMVVKYVDGIKQDDWTATRAWTPTVARCNQPPSCSPTATRTNAASCG
ncbi:MAG: hypothetical protein KIT22_04960 [Verrucomicrobiae bacterium]|nr:hypothetical protein [Verrucomicrobiae bacterium]